MGKAKGPVQGRPIVAIIPILFSVSHGQQDFGKLNWSAPALRLPEIAAGERAMYVYGTSQIHSAQSIRAPHRPPSVGGAGHAPLSGVDQLDISSEADFVSQARDLPEVRSERVAQIRAQIQSGKYETSEKLDVALERLLDEIG